MAEIINLRHARKKRGRDARRREGDANAARHGRSAAERERETIETARAERRLDGHRLGEEEEGPDPDPDAPR